MRNKAIHTLSAALIIALAGCAGSGSNTESSVSTENSSSVEVTSKTPETTPAETRPEAHLSANGIKTIDDGDIHKEMKASDLAYLMGNGINLGNTMECYGRVQVGTKESPNVYETLRNQPVTDQKSISGMKAAGFDTLRIPVAWTNTMDMENGDYTISTAYLDRVEEIINYAINEDMYVIINDHWDGGWWGMFGSSTPETVNAAWTLYESMWKQIAERYAEYGDHLVFESGNEELGTRLNDTDIAADSGALDQNACYTVVNAINQKFVDVIRSTGGNNADRFLLIAGYDTNIELTADDRFVMPSDSAKEKLMVSCHYYSPWSYCDGASKVDQWGTSKEYEDMYNALTVLKKFSDAGIPVVIGEYGVLTDGTWEKADTADYIGALLDLSDAFNFVPVLWDRSTLYSREEAKMKFDGTKALFENRSFSSQSSKMTRAEEKTAGLAAFNDSLNAAPVSFNKNKIASAGDKDKAVAWIMWNSGDWDLSYNVGDIYTPDSLSAGVDPTDVLVTGEGSYYVNIDFTKAGNSEGTAFSAIGIYNGEDLFPGYSIEVISFRVNEKDYPFIAKPYTVSQDRHCTRMNLYNIWVTSLSESARRADGDLTNASPCVIPGPELGSIEKIEIVFDYVSPERAEEYAADRDSWYAGINEQH